MWNTLFIEPLTKSLLYLSDITGSLGVAIILLTFIIQLVLTPLRLPSLKSSEKMRELKPELDKLKKKHGKDAQALALAQMELYKQHGVNPIGGILTMLLSLPIIIALYQVFNSTLKGQVTDARFLWLNLAEPDRLFILPVVVIITQWLLTRYTMPAASSSSSTQAQEDQKGAEDMAQSMQKNMLLIFPIMLGVITLQSPSGLGIYFVASAVFAIMQQIWIRKRSQKSNI